MRQPPRWALVLAFALLAGAAAWTGASALQRRSRGLAEDRIVFQALGTARATARLVEAGRGTVTPHLVAFGNAVGEHMGDVLRLVVVDTGVADAFGVRRGASTLYALDGATGPVMDVDRPVTDRANRLATLFEPETSSRPLPLDQLVEVSVAEPGWLRVAAFAPVVVDGAFRGMAAALVRTPAPTPAMPWALFVIATVVIVAFWLGLTLLPKRRLLVLVTSVLALPEAATIWVPRTVAFEERAALAERAEDWLAIQAAADAHEPVALAAPVAGREAWSPDGALRLEREPGTAPASDVAHGAERVGGPKASIHVHAEVAELVSGRPTALWILAAALGALLLGFFVGPTARLLHGLATRPGTYAYVAPAVVALVVLVFLPFVTGIGLAFYRYHLEGNAYEYVGLGNFAEILAPDPAADMHFWRTLGVTLLWTVSNVTLHVAIGLALALVLNRTRLAGKGLYRVLLILPWAVPSYITALMWRSMFVGQAGPVNSLLATFGLRPVEWLDDRFWTNFVPNLVTNTWLGFPFMMVVALGALQSIPKDLYEAASLDGASAIQRFRHVTLPLLRPALVPAIVLGTVWTFNLFNVIYLVSMGHGHTEILITEAYRAFHEQHRYGWAAAYGVLIFCLLFGYTMITTRVTKASQGAVG